MIVFKSSSTNAIWYLEKWQIRKMPIHIDGSSVELNIWVNKIMNNNIA